MSWLATGTALSFAAIALSLYATAVGAADGSRPVGLAVACLVTSLAALAIDGYERRQR